MINWNPLVNTRFSLEDEFGLEDGYIEELTFESGKKRTFLKNSFVPRVIPSLNLLLDNKRLFDEKTEFEEFENWFNNDLRYGVLPFIITRLGFKRKFVTKTDEMGIYRFLPNSVKYDKFDGKVLVLFGLEEEGVIAEIEYVFLVTNKKELILTNNGKFIAVDIV